MGTSRQPLHVAGAGPAGLAAALTAARSGVRAVVHERASDVGHRFHGDFQGLENWTTGQDVLEELAGIGIEPGFEHVPFREQVCFDPDGREYVFRSCRPFYYLVRRGPDPGTLDSALKDQALAAGVEIRWHDAVTHLPNGGVVAQGPRAADAIAVGWVFETDMADGAFAAVRDDLAPSGYAYLLAHGGRGTLATCMFDDFHNEKEYLDRALDFFRSRVTFRMERARRFGGLGNVGVPPSATQGRLLFAGEAAGFQDPLWGFGMRYAMISGHLAGWAWIDGKPEAYDPSWQRRLGGALRSGMVNRWLYSLLRDRGYRVLLKRLARSGDPHEWLRRHYGPSVWKRWVYPVAKRSVKPATAPEACGQEGCDCTWCRCVRELRGAGAGGIRAAAASVGSEADGSAGGT